MPIFKSLSFGNVKRLSELYVHKYRSDNLGLMTNSIAIDTDESWYGSHIVGSTDIEYVALKGILDCKDIRRVVLRPSLQVGTFSDALFYNSPCMLQGYTLYVGSPCDTTSMPLFWNLFPLCKSLDGIKTVIKDESIFSLMGEALKGIDYVSRRGVSVVYRLGMVGDVPVIVGYDGTKSGGVLNYPYKSGNSAYDNVIEKLVSFSDRFSLRYAPIELDSIYWFGNLSNGTDVKANVIFNSSKNEYSMCISRTGNYPEIKNLPLLPL